MFFTPNSAHGSFVVHFTSNPAFDFGIWARGYAEAAQRLSDSLLAAPGFGDNNAYPVVFLYRHALELYLKGVIMRGNHLVGLWDEAEFYERLKADHRLIPLYEAAKRLLERSFPGDTGLQDLIKNLGVVVADLDAVDPGSYNFRYPVNKNYEKPAEGQVTMSLVPLQRTMAEVLDALDTVDTVLQVEADAAEDALTALYNAYGYEL